MSCIRACHAGEKQLLVTAIYVLVSQSSEEEEEEDGVVGGCFTRGLYLAASLPLFSLART